MNVQLNLHQLSRFNNRLCVCVLPIKSVNILHSHLLSFHLYHVATLDGFLFNYRSARCRSLLPVVLFPAFQRKQCWMETDNERTISSRTQRAEREREVRPHINHLLSHVCMCVLVGLTARTWLTTFPHQWVFIVALIV